MKRGYWIPIVYWVDKCRKAEAERDRLTKIVSESNAYCLNKDHDHQSRLEEGVCSLIFQRDTLKAERDRLREGMREIDNLKDDDDATLEVARFIARSHLNHTQALEGGE